MTGLEIYKKGGDMVSVNPDKMFCVKAETMSGKVTAILGGVRPVLQ